MKHTNNTTTKSIKEGLLSGCEVEGKSRTTAKLSIKFGVYDGIEYSCVFEGRYDATVSSTGLETCKRLASDSLITCIEEKLSRPIVMVGDVLTNPDAAILVISKIEVVE